MTLKREQSEELPSNNEKILQHYVEKMGDLIAVSDEGVSTNYWPIFYWCLSVNCSRDFFEIRDSLPALTAIISQQLLLFSTLEQTFFYFLIKLQYICLHTAPQIRRDEDYDLQNERELARLRYENRYLRECLKIGRDFGSIPPEENKSQT